MPCTSDGYPSGNDSNKKELDRLSARLCEVLTWIEARHPKQLSAFSPPVRSWWENHKRIDAERLRREKEAKEKKKIREAALAKLTPRERKELGL